MIGFSTSNFDSRYRSPFWKYILQGEYELTMARNGDVIGPEIVVMKDQGKASDIADIAKDIVVYENVKGSWKQRKK